MEYALDDAVWDVEDIEPGEYFEPIASRWSFYIYRFIDPVDETRYLVRLQEKDKGHRFSTFAEAKAWLRSMMLCGM
jgi:hypothetical protein